MLLPAFFLRTEQTARCEMVRPSARARRRVEPQERSGRVGFGASLWHNGWHLCILDSRQRVVFGFSTCGKVHKNVFFSPEVREVF